MVWYHTNDQGLKAFHSKELMYQRNIINLYFELYQWFGAIPTTKEQKLFTVKMKGPKQVYIYYYLLRKYYNQLLRRRDKIISMKHLHRLDLYFDDIIFQLNNWVRKRIENSQLNYFYLSRMYHCVLFFRVKVLTQLNQQVKISGNIPELGNWDPNLAVSLHTEDTLYPTWLNQGEIQVRSKQRIEFKLIITDNDKVCWEQLPNRSLELRSLKQFVWCTFNVMETKVIPIINYSSESLTLIQDDLDKARRYELDASYDPFESERSSVSDMDGDGLQWLIPSNHEHSYTSLPEDNNEQLIVDLVGQTRPNLGLNRSFIGEHS